ncbi:MAG: HNH endonuclease [Acidimicrobiales bacterium]
MADDHEYGVRLAAIQYVHALRDANDGFVTWAQLKAFRWGGVDVPLIGASGIWKPVALSAPISITTSPSDPYGDDITEDGLLRYRYFGGPGDEQSHFNAGLRRAFRQSLPLIYFRGVRKGLYQALAPVVIMAVDPISRTFTVACDDIELVRPDLPPEVTEEVRRSYTTRLALRRLHQAAFRRKVLDAYVETCAVCRLKVKGLLDAAHIVADTHPLGDPVVPNGLALCKIHHAAFDQNIIGIRPDEVVELNREVLAATDGPMLRHGLQEVHRTRLWVPPAPTKRPDPERLEVRYDEFRRAS